MKLTKQQKKAIKSLVFDIDELDNKPRRLFQALREFTGAFLDNKTPDQKKHFREVISSINEFEEYYYLFLDIPEIIRDVVEAGRNTKKELMRQEFPFMDKDSISYYENGVENTTSLMAQKIIESILRFHNY